MVRLLSRFRKSKLKEFIGIHKSEDKILLLCDIEFIGEDTWSTVDAKDILICITIYPVMAMKFIGELFYNAEIFAENPENFISKDNPNFEKVLTLSKNHPGFLVYNGLSLGRELSFQIENVRKIAMALEKIGEKE